MDDTTRRDQETFRRSDRPRGDRPRRNKDQSRRAQTLRLSRAAAERAAKRKQLAELLSSTPPALGPDAERADAWVRQGVARLAKGLDEDDHVVLMASSYQDTKCIGVGSSVRCDSMVALTALGRLVNEINNAFTRDGVEVRLSLRMTQLKEQI